jgi:hypothetical protein
MPIHPDALLVRSASPLAAELDGETVLMSLEAGRYYGMEGTARRVWALLATPRTATDLAGSLVAEFAVTPEQCLRDLTPFLEELVREGLVAVDGG